MIPVRRSRRECMAYHGLTVPGYTKTWDLCRPLRPCRQGICRNFRQLNGFADPVNENELAYRRSPGVPYQVGLEITGHEMNSTLTRRGPKKSEPIAGSLNGRQLPSPTCSNSHYGGITVVHGKLRLDAVSPKRTFCESHFHSATPRTKPARLSRNITSPTRP